MSKIILEGVFQTSDPVNRNGSRIYPKSAFDKAHRDYVKILRVKSRKKKIQKIFDRKE